MLYVKSDEGLSISWINPGTIPFRYLKTVFAIPCSTGNHFIFLICDGSIDRELKRKFRQKRIHLFLNKSFEVWFFKFFFKRGNHEEHLIIEMWLNYNSLLNAGVRNFLWRYRNFILAFIFLRTGLGTKVLYCVVLLNGIAAKDILITFNPNKAGLFEGSFFWGGSI